MHRTIILVFCVIAACEAGPVGSGDGVVDDVERPEPGWEAELVGTAHDVAGTAVIVDSQTLELRDFVYDGGGIDSRLYLLADGEVFHEDGELTDNLVGMPSDGATLVLTIPDEAPIGTWNLITLWCRPARVSFGMGVFEPPEG